MNKNIIGNKNLATKQKFEPNSPKKNPKKLDEFQKYLVNIEAEDLKPALAKIEKEATIGGLLAFMPSAKATASPVPPVAKEPQSYKLKSSVKEIEKSPPLKERSSRNYIENR